MESFQASGLTTRAATGNLNRQFCLESHWLSPQNQMRKIRSPYQVTFGRHNDKYAPGSVLNGLRLIRPGLPGTATLECGELSGLWLNNQGGYPFLRSAPQKVAQQISPQFSFVGQGSLTP